MNACIVIHETVFSNFHGFPNRTNNVFAPPYNPVRGGVPLNKPYSGGDSLKTGKILVTPARRLAVILQADE